MLVPPYSTAIPFHAADSTAPAPAAATTAAAATAAVPRVVAPCKSASCAARAGTRASTPWSRSRGSRAWPMHERNEGSAGVSGVLVGWRVGGWKLAGLGIRKWDNYWWSTIPEAEHARSKSQASNVPSPKPLTRQAPRMRTNLHGPYLAYSRALSALVASRYAHRPPASALTRQGQWVGGEVPGTEDSHSSALDGYDLKHSRGVASAHAHALPDSCPTHEPVHTPTKPLKGQPSTPTVARRYHASARHMGCPTCRSGASAAATPGLAPSARAEWRGRPRTRTARAAARSSSGGGAVEGREAGFGQGRNAVRLQHAHAWLVGSRWIQAHRQCPPHVSTTPSGASSQPTHLVPDLAGAFPAHVPKAYINPPFHLTW